MTPFQQNIVDGMSTLPEDMVSTIRRVLIIRSVPTPQVEDLTIAMSRCLPHALFTILTTVPPSGNDEKNACQLYPYGRYFQRNDTPDPWYRTILKKTAPDIVVLPMAGETAVGYENVLEFLQPMGDLPCLHVDGGGHVFLRSCAEDWRQPDPDSPQCHGRPEVVTALPHSVTMNLTEVCNLRCVMCDSDVKGRPARMEHDLFRSASVQLLPHCRHLTLNGFVGEPLCHPQFKEILGHIDSNWPNIAVLFATNATLLNVANAAAIARSRVVREIRFSLNASSAATYEKMMPPARFKNVLENIQSFMDQLEKVNRTREVVSSLSFVATRHNITEMADMVLLAASLGIAQVMIWDLMISQVDNRQHALQGNRKEHRILLSDHVQKTMSYARQYGVRLIVPPSFGTDGQAHANRGSVCSQVDCTFPWSHTYLSPNGEIVPCCFYNRSMGNLNNSSFQEIWNGSEYRQFRRQITEGEIPVPCRSCTQNAAADLKAPQIVQHLNRYQPKHGKDV